MAFKLINVASIALFVLSTLVAAGVAKFDNKDGNFNDLVCKNSKNPTEAMELVTKKVLKITRNAFNANRYTSMTAKACAKAYKNAEFEINQIKEIIRSKDLKALKAYISAASLQYTKLLMS